MGWERGRRTVELAWSLDNVNRHYWVWLREDGIFCVGLQYGNRNSDPVLSIIYERLPS